MKLVKPFEGFRVAHTHMLYIYIFMYITYTPIYIYKTYVHINMFYQILSKVRFWCWSHRFWWEATLAVAFEKIWGAKCWKVCFWPQIWNFNFTPWKMVYLKYFKMGLLLIPKKGWFKFLSPWKEIGGQTPGCSGGFAPFHFEPQHRGAAQKQRDTKCIPLLLGGDGCQPAWEGCSTSKG